MKISKILILSLIIPPLFLAYSANLDAAGKRKKKEVKIKIVTPEEIGALKNKEIKIVQKVIYRKAKRHEASLLGAYQFNDPWVKPLLLGFSYTYHIKEDLGVEVLPFSWGFKYTTSDWDDITSDPYNDFPDANRIIINSQVNAVYSPIYAKLNFFSLKVIHFDIFGIGGISYSATRRLIDEEERGYLIWSELEHYPGLNLGAGGRFFINRWMTLKLELRDTMFVEKVRNTGGSRFQNNLMVFLEYSFYIPLTPPT